ncbi:GUN4 domain-containing protein [Gloeothece verrucosa]|uniref:GUN4 domain protein n=1 Tax=Gloeothece verrucosa (strain PCC 7822) TaxID=497965 RepID=E0UFB8_GLOV7|nr:GUN4 domain-containing protein [Gloeothece verrucosa]ADN15489.1 GUN4 domain protein [Gloeothece verrucosa PCC 7822]
MSKYLPMTPKVSYSVLRQLLEAGRWKEADQETALLMLKIADKLAEKYLTEEDIKNLPAEDLCIINRLWIDYSKAHFGLSIQKDIFQNLGGTAVYNEFIWKKFCDSVGWRNQGKWLYYNQLNFNLKAPRGHLPQLGCLGEGHWGSRLRQWSSLICRPEL